MSKPAAKDIAYDKIMTWLVAPQSSTLSPCYKDIFNRWKKADDLLDKYPIQNDAIVIYQKRFPNLSKPQVYIDFTNAKKLFNNYKSHDKERLRRWLINDILKFIEITSLAGAKGFKAKNSAYNNLIKAAKLDIKDDTGIDP